MGKVRFLFFVASMCTFLAVTAWSTWNYERTFRTITTTTQTSAWALAQLEIDVYRLQEALKLYQAGQADSNQLSLSYDIAWNRMDVFLTGEANQEIRQRFAAEELVRSILAVLQRHEAAIATPSPADPQLAQMSQELGALTPRLRDIMVQNFTGPNALRESRLLDEAKIRNFAAIGILLLFSLIMLVLLFRESRKQHFLAWNDVLTQLPNRAAFMNRLVQLTEKPGSQVVLCLVDLSRFKEVNDSLGHAAGDRLLAQIAGLLLQNRNEDVYLARIGSDEFALVMFGNMSDYSWFAYSRKIYNQLERLLHREDPAHRVKLNMGISQYPQHANTVEEMVLFADLALASAKQDKQLHYQVFNRFMLDQYQRKRLLAGHLQELLAEPHNTELFLCYQPIINISQPQQLGVEVLIRWEHPKLNFINPPDIIEIAEENGLGERLAEWLFRRMRHDIASFPADTLRHIHISINLSGSIFNQNLVNRVSDWLQDGPLPASQLILELTENIALEDVQLSRKIFTQLKERQIHIALDDFGTGWSSFSYLKDLSFDKLKIDKSFIKHLDRDKRLPLFVQAITDLSHQLGISVVAEGVETESELSKILEIGANEIQGYYYSRPLRAEAFLDFAEHYLAGNTRENRARSDLA